MKKLKVFAALGLAALMAAQLAAVPVSADLKEANADPVNTEVTDETLIVGLPSEPSGLWGAGTGKVENEMMIVSSAIMDCLVKVDRNTGDVLPNLATEWEWVDSTHCKFTLRDDVTMTDGTPLVADDVAYSVSVWMDKSANNDTGRFLVGSEVVDDHTVIIEFNVEAPDMLNLIAWGQFGIVTEDEVNAVGGPEEADKNPVMGVGRYKFKEWAHGQYITLERNDNYWNQDYKGYFKEIRFNFVSDAASRVMAVQSGDAQVAYNIPVTIASSFQAADGLSLYAYGFGQNTRLWYNMGPKSGATADIKVRQALDKAIDFNVLAQVGTAGFGQEVHGYFPDNSKYYNETFTAEERAQDIEGAKALLAEAGYDNNLELTIIGTSDAEPVFVVLQEMLRQVGVTLNISIIDTAQFVQQSNAGEYDLCLVGDLVDARYPAMMPFFIQSTIDSFNIGGAKYTTPEIEEKVFALIEEPDEEKAKEIAGELEQTWKEEMMFSNAYGELYAAITSADLKGFATIERGYIDVASLYK